MTPPPPRPRSSGSQNMLVSDIFCAIGAGRPGMGVSSKRTMLDGGGSYQRRPARTSLMDDP